MSHGRKEHRPAHRDPSSPHDRSPSPPRLPQESSDIDMSVFFNFQISWILNIPIPYRPHDFWTACLGIRERNIFVERSRAKEKKRGRERESPCPANPASFPSFPVSFSSSHLARSRVSRPSALALFSLTISITRMTEWSESRNPEITFIVITMKHYIYAVGIHEGRRSSDRWGLHSALLTASYRFSRSSLTSVFIF